MNGCCQNHPPSVRPPAVVCFAGAQRGGQRARKVVKKGANVEDRRYVTGYEVWRKTISGMLDEERTTLHVMDGERRIAMVETLTVEDGSTVSSPVARVRYQLDNHLGTAVLELDEVGAIISYEEYHPYGTTAWWAGDSAVEVSRKRYRYTGMERDEETGFQCHGVRYYAVWLGRWGSADPIGLRGGINIFSYVRGNCIARLDSIGMIDWGSLYNDAAGYVQQQAQIASDTVTQIANDVVAEVETKTDEVISSVVATGTAYLQDAQATVEDYSQQAKSAVKQIGTTAIAATSAVASAVVKTAADQMHSIETMSPNQGPAKYAGSTLLEDVAQEQYMVADAADSSVAETVFIASTIPIAAAMVLIPGPGDEAALADAAATAMSRVAPEVEGAVSKSAIKTFSNIRPEDVVGSPIQTFTGEQIKNISRRLNYIVDASGNLRLCRISQDIGGGHIDLAGGLPVQAAGEVLIIKGNVKYIDNTSGHYIPSGPEARAAAENAFKQIGQEITDSTYLEKVWDGMRWVLK